MARFYADENVPTQVVVELRRLGHDVLTSLEAGNANRSIPDQEVIAFAVSQTRILLTLNRRRSIRILIARRCEFMKQLKRKTT